MKPLFLILIFLLLSPNSLFSETEVIKTLRGKKIKVNIVKDTEKLKLVNIKDYIPDAIVSLSYSQKSKISKKAVYKQNICLVNRYLAKQLKKANNRLKRKYKKQLKFWDCYRPWSVQKRKWSIFRTKKYVQHPSLLSKHNLGRSVDVTLVDLKGKKIKMPTNYDSFGKRASHKYKRLNKRVKRNRAILKGTMRRYGLLSNRTNWWNYSLKTKTRKKYPKYDFSIMDYFKKIKEAERNKLFSDNVKQSRDTTSISFSTEKNNNRNISQEVKSKVNSIKNKIINCFVSESERGNDLPSEVAITYTVRKNGGFYNVTIQNPKYKNKKDKLNYCIIKSFKTVNIKAISSPVVGKLPLEFSFE